MKRMKLLSKKFLVSNECLTNKPDESPEVYLFIEVVSELEDSRGRTVRRSQKTVESVKGKTWEEAWDAVADFVEQPGYELLKKEAVA